MRLTNEQIEQSIQRYSEGMSQSAIGALFGVSGNAIKGLLERRGIQARTISDAKRRLPCNHNYFNEPLDEAHTYWIGFLLADGFISEHQPGRNERVSVRLCAEDRGHLEKLAGSLGSGHKILTVDEAGGAQSVQLSIASPELANSLMRYNVMPRKSAMHLFSELIPADLLRHYFRGYFDGNGSIARHLRSKWVISNTASESFLTHFVQWIGDAIGGNTARITHSWGIHRVAWSGTHRCREILDLMYAEATVFLDRKMVLYQELRSESLSSNRGAYNRKSGQ